MFKSVEYVGFEGNPELKAKAEQLTPVLADVVDKRQGEVGVRWSPASARDSILDLALSRTLVNGVSAEHTTTFAADDFGRERRLRRRCAGAWSDLLSLLIDKQHRRVQEAFLEPAEA